MRTACVPESVKSADLGLPRGEYFPEMIKTFCLPGKSTRIKATRTLKRLSDQAPSFAHSPGIMLCYHLISLLATAIFGIGASAIPESTR